jgi:predicted CoA-substrate-specific enzyme activase
MSKLYFGLDVGSVSVDAALVTAEGEVAWSLYRRHKGAPLLMAADVIDEALARAEGTLAGMGVTGSGGKTVAEHVGGSFVNEIVAATKACMRFYPTARTLIDMGGEDSKLIVFEPGDEGGVRVADFSMNTVCAAGTGSFLDEQAARLGLNIENEFGELALESEHPPTIAGRCSVFAKTDMIHLQQLATPDYDIVAGLCFALARTFRSNIGRGKEFAAPVIFQGGVAANSGMVRAFREVLGLQEADLVIPELHGVMGAIGAALELLSPSTVGTNGSRAEFRGSEPLREYARSRGEWESHAALPAQDYERDLKSVPLPAGDEIIDGYAGIDVGSISTNVVVIDEGGQVLSRCYLMTAGRPLEAVRKGFAEVGAELGSRVRIRGACTTGSGRYLTADYIGADLTKNEITAHATGAAFVDPEVDTIFEIGGQDSKYIRLERGAIVDFTMNKVCAAGTGSFLEEQANKLAINVKGEFQDLALSSKRPAVLGERCTVFMESNLNLAQQKGVPKPDLLAGLAYSVVNNYLNRVVENRTVGEHIFFQGGTAANKAIKAAFEAVTGKPVTVPPHHDVLGAVGCALLAREHHRETGRETTFVGFDLSKRNYTMKSFECKSCSNNCEIHVVEIQGEKKKLFYGDRCGKYDETRKSSAGAGLPDLFAERRELLETSGAVGIKGSARGRIGMPQMTFFHEFYPFWRAFFETLGYQTVLSDNTNRRTIHQGVEHTTAETCLPIKAAHGHAADLLEKNVDYMFLPSVVDTQGHCSEMERSYMCPYVQSVPYILDSAMDIESKTQVLRPIVHMDRGRASMLRELFPMVKRLGLRRSDLRRAIGAAENAQGKFYRACQARGRDILALLPQDRTAIAIVSRPYNGCDQGMNLDLPAKLRDLGCLAIPMDFLPLDSVDLARDWWHMYWKYGQKILAAARLIAHDPRLNALYITNFGCGPDSFILKFFAKEMGSKPYLQIEIDEHSSDVGAITRCEAFLDSLKNVRATKPGKYRSYEGPLALSAREKRTVYVPYMDDHSFALAAAMRAGGMDAVPLPVSDEQSLKLGRKYTSGKECYPCVITTGDILKKVQEPGFDPKTSAFFMPTAMGPCRFGQYNKFHRMILDDLGYSDVQIMVFNQTQGFHKDTGKLGPGFLRTAWRAIVAFDTMGKLVREVRPLEKEKGSADLVYDAALAKLEKVIESRGDLMTALMNIRDEFAAVPTDSGAAPRPRIGLIGEVYVRCHKFANEFLIRKIEELGGEAVLPPFQEWLNYIAWERRTESVRQKRWGAFFKEVVSGHVQRRDRARIQDIFKDQLRGRLNETTTEAVLKLADPYIHSTIKGEACLSVGRAVEYAEDDFAGVVNIAPFGCLPSTIVASLTRKFRQNHRNLPWLDLYFDGTSQAGTQTRLEAFMAQAADFSRAHVTAPAGSGS